MKPIFKRLTLILLTLALVLPLVSCGLFGKPEARTETDFAAVSDGAAACRVIYPGGGAEADSWKKLANDLTRVIKRATGVVLEITADTAEKTGSEILLGTTNRPESETALAALGGSKTAFSFSVSGDSLVIAAANTNALSMALSYFEAQYDGALGATAGMGTMVFSKELSLTRAPATPTAEPGQLLSSAALLKFVSTEFADFAVTGEFTAVTATAVANGVLYAALSDGAGHAKLLSADLTTGKRLAASEVLSLGNATSMCYNPVLDLLAVAHGENSTVYLIDPATLTLRRTATAGAEIRKIAYDAVNFRYIAQKTQKPDRFVILTNNLSLSTEEEIKAAAPTAYGFADYELKDFCADSEYLYLLYLTSGKKQSGTLLISQSRLNTARRYCNTLTLDDGTALPLSVAADGRTFYITASGEDGLAGKTWRVQLTSAEGVSEPAGLFNSTNTAGVDSAYLSVDVLFKVYPFIKSEYSRNTVMQGACTDGRYGYFFQEYQGGSGNYSNSETHDTIIVKVDMASGELVKYSEPLKLGHSNDGCYNPHTGQLIVVYNGNNKKLIKFIDPETLEITGETRLPVNIFSIAYNEYTRQYIVGLSGGRNFGILDESFNIVTAKISTDYSGTDHKDVIYDYKLGSDLLTQGIDCDSKYVYFVLSGKKTGEKVWTDYLLAFDYEGNHVFTKVLPGMTLEVENIFHIGKDIYITCNGSLKGSRSPCYRLTVTS